MKSRYLTLLLACMGLFCFTSCSDKVENAKIEMMAIHDESMAEIGTIRTLTRQLIELKPSVPDTFALNIAIQNLEDADESMMVWMDEYKEPNDEDALEYFKAENIKISEVATKIYTSISAAKKYFND